VSGAKRSAGSTIEGRIVQPGPRESTKVAEAAQCDALGNHERALRLLAEACEQNDVEAMTRLGTRLLTADCAPYQPDRGTELVVKAANLGGAEAAAPVAVLAAIGMHLPQSWPTAMAAIVFSAERGSAAAQGQLRALAADRELAGRRIDPTLWRRLAETIDLNRWHLKSPAGVALNESPHVRHFPGFVTAEVCQWLIERSRWRLVRAPVYDAVARKETVSSTRTNTWAQFNVTHADLVSVLVQVHICANTGVAFRQLEPLSVLHYGVGEQSTEHFDFIDPLTPHYEHEVAAKGERIVTFLLYLNDDYEGGQTEFVTLGIAHKGQRGEGLFFVNALENGMPDRRTLHAGRPPTRGEKWVVSQFIRNRATF
jgi:prolyl 4-hydroxylase